MNFEIFPAKPDDLVAAAKMRDMALEMGADWDAESPPGWQDRYVDYLRSISLARV